MRHIGLRGSSALPFSQLPLPFRQAAAALHAAVVPAKPAPTITTSALIVFLIWLSGIGLGATSQLLVFPLTIFVFVTAGAVTVVVCRRCCLSSSLSSSFSNRCFRAANCCRFSYCGCCSCHGRGVSNRFRVSNTCRSQFPLLFSVYRLLMRRLRSLLR